MDRAARIALMALYPVLLVLRAAAWVTRRDPLQRRRRAGSYWIARPAPPRPRSYFSAGSARPAGSAIAAVFERLANALARLRPQDDRRPPPAQPADIPDEIYTLW